MRTKEECKSLQVVRHQMRSDPNPFTSQLINMYMYIKHMHLDKDQSSVEILPFVARKS